MIVSAYGWQAALYDSDPNEVSALSATCMQSELFTEVVPAERTVLVCWEGELSIVQIEKLVSTVSPATEISIGRLVEIPVRYDGQDLDEVAKLTGLTRSEVIELHSSTTFTAAFAGFAPGFMYCTGLPEVLQLPRRATPRVQVPAGSLAMADTYTAIYPLNSPGGWNLIGTTDVQMFDADAEQPSLLLPGDRVRFVPVSR
ncbi:MAG: 5-oxoprolinase subunit PxpB [Candidatus Nanopelagicales bacterium]